MGSRHHWHWNSGRMALFELSLSISTLAWWWDGRIAAERDEQLIIKAALMALMQRKPGVGLVHHSDRGRQYTSQGYLALLQEAKIQVSMSKKGDCYDNALMESFFGTLKEECVDRQSYQTRAEARNPVFEYIEVFCNQKRKNSSLGYICPTLYEQRMKEMKTCKT